MGSAVLFAAFFNFNNWIFSELAYTKGINWIFLPAGFRIILVLILGLPGAVGITLGTWYLDGINFFEEIDPVFLNGIVSGMTPYVLMKFSCQRPTPVYPFTRPDHPTVAQFHLALCGRQRHHAQRAVAF